MTRQQSILDEALLERFVGTFGRVDGLILFDAPPPELDDGTDDSPFARPLWKPAAISTDPGALVEVYGELPGPFPPLFERLLLSYRWLEVEVDDRVTLLGNLPGPTLRGFFEEVTADPAFVAVLFPLGLIPFGRAAGGSYDPICFDTRRRLDDADCPLLRVEHESILCDDRLGETWELAGSFRSWVETVVATSTATPGG